MYSSGELRGTRTVTLILSFISTGLHLLCSSSPQWLLVQELTENPYYIKYNMTVEHEFLIRYSYVGLFTICTHRPTNSTYELIKGDMNCTYIDMFSEDEYSPDPNDSTPVLPYCMKRGLIIMAISFVALLGGLVFSIAFACYTPRGTGHASSKYRFPKPVLAFITGTFYVIAGLAITTALVALVSTFKSEVGIKLRKISTFEDARLTYSHGWGMYWAVIAFLSCETTGTLAILAYIHAHQLEFWDDVWPAGRSPSVNRRRDLRVFATSSSKMTSQDEEEDAVYAGDHTHFVGDEGNSGEEECDEEEDEQDEQEEQEEDVNEMDEEDESEVDDCRVTDYHAECTCRYHDSSNDSMRPSVSRVNCPLPSPPSPPPRLSITTSLPKVTVGVDSASSSADGTISPPIPPMCTSLRRPSPNDLVSWTLLKEPPRGRRYSRTMGLDSRDPSPLPLLLFDKSPRESLTMVPPNLPALLERRSRSSLTPPPLPPSLPPLVTHKSPLPRLAAGVPFERRKNETTPSTTNASLTASRSSNKLTASSSSSFHSKAIDSREPKALATYTQGRKKRRRESTLGRRQTCPRHKSTPV